MLLIQYLYTITVGGIFHRCAFWPIKYYNILLNSEKIMLSVLPDPCDHSPCAPHGACFDEGPSYSCMCNEDYEGENCDESKYGYMMYFTPSAVPLARSQTLLRSLGTRQKYVIIRQSTLTASDNFDHFQVCGWSTATISAW